MQIHGVQSQLYNYSFNCTSCQYKWWVDSQHLNQTNSVLLGISIHVPWLQKNSQQILVIYLQKKIDNSHIPAFDWQSRVTGFTIRVHNEASGVLAN